MHAIAVFAIMAMLLNMIGLRFHSTIKIAELAVKHGTSTVDVPRKLTLIRQYAVSYVFVRVYIIIQHC